MTARVLLLHGWRDHLAGTHAELVALGKELDAGGADWQLHVFGRAMHAFTFVGVDMPERGLKYDAEAAQRSWSLMTEFLTETIGPREEVGSESTYPP
jgi:dienelactone hydrolase